VTDENESGMNMRQKLFCSFVSYELCTVVFLFCCRQKNITTMNFMSGDVLTRIKASSVSYPDLYNTSSVPCVRIHLSS
jgi:hypothetical protein